ncbi:hypothetical protein HDU96_001319 [Phlyctochytrium bullatum]|nr:hypothetical protein HDU96_001319 [Phlyctochytrium bullatum]
MVRVKPLGAKFGNKNWYKGTGSAGMGKWLKDGTYVVEPHKVRSWVVPSNLAECKLTPYVDPKFDLVVRSHSVVDYFKLGNLPADLVARDASLVQNMQRTAKEVYKAMRQPGYKPTYL